jgi:hypothetical protein
MNTPHNPLTKEERRRIASISWRHRNIEKARERDREAKRRERAEKGSKVYNKEMREYRSKSPETKIKSLLCIAKGRSRRKGLEFDISILDLDIPEYCPLLGVKINYKANGKGGAPTSPSLDRIDTSKGYVKGNVWIISWRANRIKSDATLEELGSIFHNLKKKISSLGR